MNFLNKLFQRKPPESPEPEPVSEDPCCSSFVHVAYRGVSDDHLYLSRDRKWGDVKFFRPNGLRVFCAGCRRRLL